jgi:hypothetical protein
MKTNKDMITFEHGAEAYYMLQSGDMLILFFPDMMSVLKWNVIPDKMVRLFNKELVSLVTYQSLGAMRSTWDIEIKFNHFNQTDSVNCLPHLTIGERDSVIRRISKVMEKENEERSWPLV